MINNMRKYRLFQFLAIATGVLPAVMIVILAIVMVLQDDQNPYTPHIIALHVMVIAVCLVCFLFRRTIDRTYYELKASIDFDEFGRRKKKHRFAYAKDHQEAMDAQRMADMERIISTSMLDRATHKGSLLPAVELNRMVGMEQIKHKIHEMAARMEFETKENKSRKRHRQFLANMESRHMVFFGAPGTGKTTVARIITGYLHKYGFIKENHCIEIDGNFFQATNPADTAIKVKYLVRKACGGVLFIDEAYALLDNGNGCGAEAVASLMKEMEDHRGRFVLIIAGYTDEMKQLLASNPGFHSRIKEYIYFPDYNEVELCEIFRSMATQCGFAVDISALDRFALRISRERKLPSFGNARTVRHILEESIDHHALNLIEERIPKEATYKIVAQDIASCANKDIQI